MALLRAKLFEMELEKQRAEIAARRKSQVCATHTTIALVANHVGAGGYG